MPNNETLRPDVPETGPKPLTAYEIECNSVRLRVGRVMSLGLGSESTFFNSLGVFYIAAQNQTDRFSSYSTPYWSQELLSLDLHKHILQTSKYGNLKVYEVQEERTIPAGKRPGIIIEAKDIRAIFKDYAFEGKVRSSGFIFPKNFPLYPLKNTQEISPEDFEQMLLTAQQNDKSQSSYNLRTGFAKVDPDQAGKDVLLFPFDTTLYSRDAKNLMQADAIVIDLAERKLMPRAFYTLSPETKTH